MILLEIIAMFLCFGSMITITVTRDASGDQDELGEEETMRSGS